LLLFVIIKVRNTEHNTISTRTLYTVVTSLAILLSYNLSFYYYYYLLVWT